VGRVAKACETRDRQEAEDASIALEALKFAE
jgi:hypothetical protein